MSSLLNLQIEHAKLLQRQQAGEDILQDVGDYIRRVVAASSRIASPHERNQLRANLRYWATYVLEKEGTYPNVELAPGPVESGALVPFIVSSSIIAVVVFVILLLIAVVGGSIRIMINLAQASSAATFTAVAYQTQTAIAATPSATFTPTPTAEPTSTPTITPTPLPPTPTPTEAGLLVRLTNLANGLDVQPIMVLAGTYANLQPGWSIHILLQPISLGGRYYPAPQFFEVRRSGEPQDWSLEIKLGEGAQLKKREQYIVTPAIALTPAQRAALVGAANTGFDLPPPGVIVFSQNAVIVTREVFQSINEVRLLYVTVDTFLYTARLDGTDARRLTDFPTARGIDPGLSPSGQRIVYVGSRTDANGETIYSLWIMDSAGQNRVMLLEERGLLYERPLWSPDGRYIAYSAGSADGDYAVYVYDTLTREKSILETGKKLSRFPSWTTNGRSLVFSAVANSNTINLDSLVVTSVLDTPGEETQPVVSTDGRRVAYVYYPDDSPGSNRDIYVFNLSTSKTQPLTTDPGLDQWPTWSPDSRTVYFETYRTSNRPSIWAVKIDGTGEHQAVDSVNHSRPHVGKMVVFLPIP